MKNQLLVFICLLVFSGTYSQENKKMKFKNLNDVNSITKVLKDKEIVALGEGTHGTKDFNDIRINISKNLIQKHGFTIIAFEQAMGDSYVLNEGINSTSNLKEIMSENLLSIWQTHEFEDFFLWVRDYNSKKKDKDKVFITGFDVNLLNNSAKILKLNSASQNHDYLADIQKLEILSDQIDQAWLESNNPDYQLDMKNITNLGTQAYLITKRVDSLYGREGNAIHKIALTNLEFGFQNFYEAGKQNYEFDRDLVMAKNIEKIQKELGAKIVVFAHNAHVTLQPTIVQGMGTYLKSKYKDSFYSLATFSSTGTYSAIEEYIDVKNNILRSYVLPEPHQDSWEKKMAQLHPEDYFINFTVNDSFSNDSLVIRFFSYTPYDKETEQYYLSKPVELSKVFDGVVFVHDSQASRPLSDICSCKEPTSAQLCNCKTKL